MKEDETLESNKECRNVGFRRSWKEKRRGIEAWGNSHIDVLSATGTDKTEIFKVLEHPCWIGLWHAINFLSQEHTTLESTICLVHI
jgi:hypothetical protein